MSAELQIASVIQSWNAPGYRDPQMILVTTDNKQIPVRLSPQAFVELHNMVCEQQGCIDRNGHEPLDMERYPFQTNYVAQRRGIPVS